MRFRSLLLCLPLILSLALTAQAQDGTDQSPATTVKIIFAAMRAADTTGLRAHFHPEARIHSVVELPTGDIQVAAGDLNRWFTGIAGAGVGSWDERTPYAEIRVDGGLATAWVPYVFYYRGELHHCGVNAFQLVNTGDGWRVLQITDTRRDAAGDCAPLSISPSPVVDIDSLVSQWHRAAAEADSAAYFGLMAADGYYLGTDKGEHWTKARFASFAGPYFARGEAWDFTATERHIFYDDDRQIAWWDEVLDTWMGPCRGTGILERQADGKWAIRHYTLSMLIPNESVREVLEVLGQ